MFKDWDKFKQQLRQVFSIYKSTIVAKQKI
jgi:hypothetical protein